MPMSLTFPTIMVLAPLFNIEDLVAYKGPIVIPDNLFDKPLLDPIDALIPAALCT